MARMKPYSNWKANELRGVIIAHIRRLQLETRTEHLWVKLVEEAFNDGEWDIVNEYNGCTAVQDYYHPCPACFVHDFMWITGRGGIISDRIFYHLMIAEGMSKPKAVRRWFAVRTAWYTYFMWKYIIRRNWKKPTNAMKSMNEYLLSLKK
jgi:hypothetical protein